MKIKGKDVFAKQLARLPDAMKDDVRNAVRDSAEDMAEFAYRLAPVQTGKLRFSIDVTMGPPPRGTISTVGNAQAAKGDEGLIATVYAGGDGAYYARFQEFGTVNMAANPFFFPAYRASKKPAMRRMQAAVRRGAKKAFGK